MEYKNKYLEGLIANVAGEECSYVEQSASHMVFEEDADRAERFNAQKAESGGYDERITWSLDDYMTEQIYTWLKMYLEYASGEHSGGWGVDLTFHKFDVDGTEMCEKDIIEEVIKCFEFYMLNSNSFDMELEEKSRELAKRGYKLLGIVLPSLWW